MQDTILNVAKIYLRVSNNMVLMNEEIILQKKERK